MLYDGSKIIVARNSYENCYEGGDEPEVSVQVIDDASDLVEYLCSSGIISSYAFTEALIGNEKSSAQLDKLGFRNVEKATRISEKIVLENRFWLLDANRGSIHAREVDPENLTSYDAHVLADDKSVLLQSVRKTALKAVNSKMYTVMQKEKKKKAERSAKAKRAAATRAANKKKKEIEKAKALLKKEGVVG